MPRRSKNVNWFETWNRRSRLRSGTRMLSSLDTPSDEPPGFSKKRPSPKIEDDRPIPEQDAADDQPRSPKTAGGNTEEAPDSVSARSEVDEKDIDPEYKMFLDHLRVDGQSYVFEMVIDGSPVVLKYEEEDLSEVIQSKPKRGRDSAPSKAGSQKKLKRGDSAGPNSSGIVDGLPPTVGAQIGTVCSVVDEDYRTFLNHVREHDGSMILEMHNGVVIRYEEEEVRRAEEEVIAVRNDQQVRNGKEKKNENGKAPKQVTVKSEPIEYEDTDTGDVVEELPNGFEVLSEHDKLYSCALDLQVDNESPTSSNSPARGDDPSGECLSFKISVDFKDRLGAVLKKPFDQNEYNELLTKASNRGAIEKEKHLRTVSKSYATEKSGRSYFDHHPDLAKLVESADYRMGLSLLRGFFFWIVNVSHEGAFKPWETLPSKSPDSVPLQVQGPKDSALFINCAS